MDKARANAEKIAFFLDTVTDRRLSEHTRRTYDTALTDIYGYLLDKDKGFEEVSLFDIRDYKKTRLGDFAPSTQNLKLSVLRKFYDVMGEYGVISYNPVVKSFNNRLEKKALTYVTEDNYKIIENYFKENSSDNYVLGLRLMFFSGLRVGEVGITDLISDVIFQGDKMYLKVHGKGAKERVVPVFSWAAVRQIKEFRSSHQSLLPLRVGSFTQTYDYHLKKISKKLSLPVYSCHDFRRGFAVNLYKQTHDLELLRVLLGHESYNTTLMYIRNATVKIYDLPPSLYA